MSSRLEGCDGRGRSPQHGINDMTFKIPSRRSLCARGIDDAHQFYNTRSMESTRAVTLLGALAQETRLAIFRLLVRAHSPQAGEGGLGAGDIANSLKVPPATLSFHLKEMAHAGLVTSRREGRAIIYSADLTVMQALTGFLLDDCCKGACGTLDKSKICC